jgi:hypothetical protein
VELLLLYKPAEVGNLHFFSPPDVRPPRSLTLLGTEYANDLTLTLGKIQNLITGYELWWYNVYINNIK